MFHICSPGQIQFTLPIYNELIHRNVNVTYYLSCDYPISTTYCDDMNIPSNHFVEGHFAKYLPLINTFIETEIYGRGPKQAKKIFIGHGQPNKWTYWSDDNLKAFDYYFLYGELCRSMFEYVVKDQPESSKHIQLLNVGYPKLDAQINGVYKRDNFLEKLALNPKLKTVVYAPAWDHGGTVRTLGTKIAELLLEIENINVIVKLHPASLEPENSPDYEWLTGGVNWKERFTRLEKSPNYRYIDDYYINPVLAACDLMVTDFSGVALEFMVLDRPVIYIHCPEFYESLAKFGNDPVVAQDDERFNAGRHAGVVVYDLNELKSAVISELENPMNMSQKRKDLMKKFLYNPGKGSKVAVDNILAMLE